VRSWIYHHSGLVVGTAPASFEASHRKGGIVDTDPNTLLARLTHVIKIAKCFRDLYHKEVERRKALEKQLDWVYRQSMAIAKNIYGEK
jgi:hypothetical protein